MKKLLLLSIFILSLYSCQNDQKAIELTNLLSELGDEEQNFTIPSDSVSKITGEYGTRIFVKPADLVLENGGSANGKIRLELTELTTKEALIKHNAQTRSGGDWLISGGAYNIQFFDESGAQLKLRDGKTLEVQFPKFADEPMQLFSGTRDEKGLMNWSLMDVDFEEKRYQSFLVTDTLVLDCEAARRYRVDTLKEVKKAENLGLRTFRELKNLKNDFDWPKGDTLYFSNDTLVRYRYIDYSDDFGVIDEEALSKKNIDKIVTDKVRLDSVMFSIRNPIDFIASESPCGLITTSESLRISPKYKFESALYETVQLAKLGWINVDRFYPDIEERLELKISNGDQFTLLYVIDESNNTVLNVYAESDFKISLPKGRQFKVLGFFLDDEKLFAARKAVRLIEDRELELKMKPIDLKDVEKYFN